MAKQYKWELRKGSKKEVCPHCGQRRFVPYVSALDHQTMAGPTYGRCDREQHCGYHLYPGKEVSSEGIEKVVLPEEEPIRFSPAAIMVSPYTPLFKFFVNRFGAEKAIEAWQMYKVGNDNGRAVFWQIAKDGTIRGGKSIPYMDNGHRDKTDKFPANWLHRSRTYAGMYTGTRLDQCLFGEHLLNEYPDKKVAVVESEKTALAMSIIQPDYIWLASGGSKGLSDKKCHSLRGRTVRLFPDHGQWYAWSVIAGQYGFEVDDFVEQHPLFDGCDLLDYYA